MKLVKKTVWNICEHVTVRTLLERLKASGNNEHCMDGMQYTNNLDGTLRHFHGNWDWIKSQSLDSKLYVVDYVEQNTFLT